MANATPTDEASLLLLHQAPGAGTWLLVGTVSAPYPIGPMHFLNGPSTSTSCLLPGRRHYLFSVRQDVPHIGGHTHVFSCAGDTMLWSRSSSIRRRKSQPTTLSIRSESQMCLSTKTARNPSSSGTSASPSQCCPPWDTSWQFRDTVERATRNQGDSLLNWLCGSK